MALIDLIYKRESDIVELEARSFLRRGIMQFAYDENHDTDHIFGHGWYECQSCRQRFYGAFAIHNRECKRQNGFEACIYTFGPHELKGILEAYAKTGNKAAFARNPALTYQVLEELFPHLLAQAAA